MLIYFVNLKNKREVVFTTDFSVGYYFSGIFRMWSVDTLGM